MTDTGKRHMACTTNTTGGTRVLTLPNCTGSYARTSRHGRVERLSTQAFHDVRAHWSLSRESLCNPNQSVHTMLWCRPQLLFVVVLPTVATCCQIRLHVPIRGTNVGRQKKWPLLDAGRLVWLPTSLVVPTVASAAAATGAMCTIFLYCRCAIGCGT